MANVYGNTIARKLGSARWHYEAGNENDPDETKPVESMEAILWIGGA